MMKAQKLMVAFAVAAAMSGCQTRITAEKRPELLLPVQRVAEVDGTNVVYTIGYERASGGWYATARSPLWAREDLRGLAIEVETNGTVRLALEDYSRDMSTNAVVMTHEMFTGAALLTEKVAAAIATCGGSSAASGLTSGLKSAIARFVENGGDAAKATVSCKDGNCTITDGTVSETCANCYDR